MKMKKITAAALAAALVITSTGISGLAAEVQLKLKSTLTELKLGETATVTATVTPESASDAVESGSNAIKWEVGKPGKQTAIPSKTSIDVKADVDEYLKAAGNITVKATLTGESPSNASATDTIKITVAQPKITADALTVDVGKTGTIEEPSITNVASSVSKYVEFAYELTAGSDCAKLDGKTVTGVKAGTATITVNAIYDGKTETPLATTNITVTVKEPEKTQEFAWKDGSKETTLALQVGAEGTLDFGGATGTVTPTVDHENIATAKVDGNTLTVTAKAEGTATITLKDGAEKTLTAKVTVTKEDTETEIKGSDPRYGIAIAPDATQEEKAFAGSVLVFFETNDEVTGLLREAAGIIATELKLNLSAYAELKGREVEVYIDTKLKDVDMVDGVVKSVTYDITPYAIGSKVGEKDVTINLSDRGFELKEKVDIPIPVPGEKRPLAFVKHKGDKSKYFPIEGEYVHWETTHFSEVTAMPVYEELTLVNPNGIYTHEDKDGRWYGTSIEIYKDRKVYYKGSGNLNLTVSEQDKAYIDCTLESDEDGTYILITARKLTPDYAKLVLTNVDTEDDITFWVKVTAAPSRPYTPPTVTGSGSGSGSGSSYTQATEASGEWVVGEKGWWFRFKDGSYPSNGWMQLEWQGKTDWYYFNAEGYMVSGWITDVDGHRYFLHDQMDGTQGYMYTGWHQIDGKWYYFSTVSGGPLGSLLTNTTTPDGYAVGADGVWLQ